MLARNHPAVWLFIRYDGLPGLFFAVTVLCAGWFYLRRNITDAVGYLAVLAAFWLPCNSSGCSYIVRQQVVTVQVSVAMPIPVQDEEAWKRGE